MNWALHRLVNRMLSRRQSEWSRRAPLIGSKADNPTRSAGHQRTAWRGLVAGAELASDEEGGVTWASFGTFLSQSRPFSPSARDAVYTKLLD